MAKAQFHRHQKVWVEAVGAWATIERIIPVWAKGFDEPVRITYDVGLGREFRGEDLRADSTSEAALAGAEGGQWRILRAAQQVAGAGGLQPPSVARHLPGGRHRHHRLGRLAGAGGRVRPRPLTRSSTRPAWWFPRPS